MEEKNRLYRSYFSPRALLRPAWLFYCSFFLPQEKKRVAQPPSGFDRFRRSHLVAHALQFFYNKNKRAVEDVFSDDSHRGLRRSSFRAS